MMDFHTDIFPGYKRVRFIPRSMDFTTVPQDFRRPIQRTRLTTSLSIAKKQKRDRARMTAFIRKKTAENLPFSSIEPAELVKLGTNNSLCFKPNAPPKTVTTTSTQTSLSHPSEVNQEDFRNLQEENARLQQELQQLTRENETIQQRALECDTVLFENISLRQKAVAFDSAFKELKEVSLQKSQLAVKIMTLELELSDANSFNSELQTALSNSEQQLSDAHLSMTELQNMLECPQTYQNDVVYNQPDQSYFQNQPDQFYTQDQSDQFYCPNQPDQLYSPNQPDQYYQTTRRGRRHRRGR